MIYHKQERTWQHGERVHSCKSPSHPKWVSCSRQNYGYFAVAVLIFAGIPAIMLEQSKVAEISLVVNLILAFGNIIGKKNT
jgi:hypothetical protein